VSDYIVRPWLVGSKNQSHPLLMLISLLGGIEVLGLPGLIVGPVVMSLFVAALRIYERQIVGAARALAGGLREKIPAEGALAPNDQPVER
jgi:predicted PurR-regulated permease PerM